MHRLLWRRLSPSHQLLRWPCWAARTLFVVVTMVTATYTGSGTNWPTTLVGSMICLPLTGGDYTAYAVMAVLAPDSVVLSRSYSGPNQSNVTYQLVVGDDFAVADTDLLASRGIKDTVLSEAKQEQF